jgi:uncharacterized protein (TIGR02246 family)
MPDVESRLMALERRVQQVEDELAIHRLVVRYGFAVDIGDADGAAAVFADDSVYDVDVGVMQGPEAVRTMVRAPRHQSMVGRCAHQIGPIVVRVAGDTAVAVGYSRVYLRDGDVIRIHRVSYNRWELERRAGGWLIVRRVTRLLGHEQAKALMASAAGDL